jgi:uncharacterized protein
MINRYDNRTVNKPSYAAAGIDVGLRSYMLKVYNFMALGLGITGVVAYMVSQSPEMMQLLFQTPLKWVVLLAPLGIVLFFSFGISRMNPATARIVFWFYAAMMGLSLGALFYVYTGQSLARVFFITSSVFGAMSLYGYTTKRDLTSFGSFLFMGLLGIVLASLVNLFLQSPAIHFITSAIGVLVFTGLTAYDTQKIKDMYYEATSQDGMEKTALMGALALYLDFINLFIVLLRFFGDRR